MFKTKKIMINEKKKKKDGRIDYTRWSNITRWKFLLRNVINLLFISTSYIIHDISSENRWMLISVLIFIHQILLNFISFLSIN